MTLTRTKRIGVVIGLAVVLTTLVSAAFVALLPEREPPARLSIITSFYPLQEFTTRLVGTDVRVQALVPPGVEPHDWEPSPGDVLSVAAADLVVYIHARFETFIPELLAAVPEAPPAVATSEGRDLVTLETGEIPRIDPHIWLDPIMAQQQVPKIRDALIQIDPDYEAGYRERAEGLLADLEALHAEILEGLKGCEFRTFIASHAAFTYFARRYNLTLESISLDPEVGPGPARIRALIDYALTYNLTIIYTEPLVAAGAADVVAEEIGGKTLPLDPVEGLTSIDASSDRTYFSIMRNNLTNLRIGLRCS